MSSSPSLFGPALVVEEAVKEYRTGEARVRALDGVSLEVGPGEFVAVMGPSGSGKSTLLNVIAGIDTLTSGTIRVEGRALAELDDDALTRLRRDRIGMIYQFFNLLPTLSVRENVALPALLAGRRESQTLEDADRLLADVDLVARRDARPATLSGGEMQRAAIARALIQRPALVLADEPTGNLDSRAAAQVMALLRDVVTVHRAAVVLVTHDADAARAAERVITLRDGRLDPARSFAP